MFFKAVTSLLSHLIEWGKKKKNSREIWFGIRSTYQSINKHNRASTYVYDIVVLME